MTLNPNTLPHSRGAKRPSCAKFLRLEKSEGAGLPQEGSRESRVPVAPAAPCAKVESTRVLTTGSPESPGLPCAMALTVSFALSLVTGLFCHHRRRKFFRRLDASVGASGPHDFAVRVSTVRPRKEFALRCCRVHRIPHPTSVTIAIRPQAGRDSRVVEVIWVKREQECFCERGWTAGSVICPTRHNHVCGGRPSPKYTFLDRARRLSSAGL
jgi:hypothetical protein